MNATRRSQGQNTGSNPVGATQSFRGVRARLTTHVALSDPFFHCALHAQAGA
jgi:hypothetical protein